MLLSDQGWWGSMAQNNGGRLKPESESCCRALAVPWEDGSRRDTSWVARVHFSKP